MLQGSNRRGQLGVGLERKRLAAPMFVAGNLTFESISCGTYHTCALGNKAAWCWGVSWASA